MIARSWFPVLIVALSACVTSEYVGKSYPATQSVDMFFSMDDVSRPHEVMGMIEGHGSEYDSYDHMEQVMVKDAMEKGADAIVFLDMDVQKTGSTTSTVGRSDPTWSVDRNGRLKKHGGSAGYTYTTDIREKVIKAQLVKYIEG